MHVFTSLSAAAALLVFFNCIIPKAVPKVTTAARSSVPAVFSCITKPHSFHCLVNATAVHCKTIVLTIWRDIDYIIAVVLTAISSILQAQHSLHSLASVVPKVTSPVQSSAAVLPYRCGNRSRLRSIAGASSLICDPALWFCAFWIPHCDI